MFKQLKLILLFIILIYPVFAQAEISVIDDKGRTVKLEKSAERIISLAPHITESLFEAGAGDKIIAAVSYSDYPEAAKKIPRVGGYPTLDIEKIVSLKPDLVIAWASGNNPAQVERLITLGLTVFMSEPRYPKDVAKTIQRFGQLAGTTDISSPAYARFMRHYDSLKKNFSNRKKVKVFYQIWNKPLMTISGNHLISDIISLCGGKNVFSELKILTPRISIESVIASLSEVIVSGGMGKARPDWLDDWKAWPVLPAVKNEHLYFVDPALMQRVGPRILDGADKLCEILEKVRKR
jgi:iron complex transport system substrate-binding protein